MGSITTTVSSILTNALETDGTAEAIQEYVEEGYNSVTGRLTRWGTMLSANLSQSGRVTGELAEKSVDTFLGSIVTSASSLIGNVISTKLFQALNLPNIEGITLYSPSITVSREVDISEEVFIIQKDSENKYVINNSVPHLRKWEIDAYIQSISPKTDAASGSHASLQVQEKLLDNYAKARRPLWFKTHQNEFVQVMIANYSYQYVAESMNATHVSLSLVEYKALELAYGTLGADTDSSLTVSTSTSTSKAAALVVVMAALAAALAVDLA